MNEILKNDIKEFVTSFPLKDQFADSCFLITGATGLIGSILIHTLLAFDRNISILAPVRNINKAKEIFDKAESVHIRFIECDLATYDYSHIGNVDYIVHCAAPTASKFFVEHPVETFNIIVQGTQRLLEYAKGYEVKGFVYLSSLEVYGTITDDSNQVTEDFQGYLDPFSARSSYPMAKRATETLCSLYSKEYNIPVKIARLTQTTGAGISDNDNRVIAQFSKLAFQGRDIILHSSGNSARPYCYTMDSVSAILYLLLKGKSGEAYNVANEESYISAKELAYYIRDNFNSAINVRVETDTSMGYAPETRLPLSTEKLLRLGWKPNYSLSRIIDNLIKSLIKSE